MSHAVATVLHLIESSKPEARAEGNRLIVLLEVPWLLEERPCRASVAVDKLPRDKAVRDKKIAGVFVLISPMSVSRLCRLDKGSSRDARRFLRPAMAWESRSRWPRSMRSVGSCDTRRTRLTPCACPMLFVGLLSALREFSFSLFCRDQKYSAKRDVKCCNSWNSVKTRKKKTS